MVFYKEIINVFQFTKIYPRSQNSASWNSVTQKKKSKLATIIHQQSRTLRKIWILGKALTRTSTASYNALCSGKFGNRCLGTKYQEYSPETIPNKQKVMESSFQARKQESQ